jgi:hypothetical protein
MRKKNKNFSDTQNDLITIDNELIEPLFRTERWSEKVENSTSSDALGEDLVQTLCSRPILGAQSIDVERLTKITSEDIIDKFLRADTHRIVAEEGEVTQEIVVEAAFDEEDDMVSEELAEIYLAQGLKDMAKETYRKLSLLNPEKSIYFAEIISKIDSNN